MFDWPDDVMSRHGNTSARRLDLPLARCTLIQMYCFGDPQRERERGGSLVTLQVAAECAAGGIAKHGCALGGVHVGV